MTFHNSWPSRKLWDLCSPFLHLASLRGLVASSAHVVTRNMHGALWKGSVALPVPCARDWREVCPTAAAPVAAAERAEAPSSRRGQGGSVRARRTDCTDSFSRRAPASASAPVAVPSSGSAESGLGDATHAWRPGAGPHGRRGARRLSRARGTPSADIFESDHDAFSVPHAPSRPLEAAAAPVQPEASQSPNEAEILTLEPPPETSSSEAPAEAATSPDSHLLSRVVSQPEPPSVPGLRELEVQGLAPGQGSGAGVREEAAGSGETPGEESSSGEGRSLDRLEQRRQEAAQEAAASMATLAETAVTTSLLGAVLQADGSAAGTASSTVSTSRTGSPVRPSPGPGTRTRNATAHSSDRLQPSGNAEPLADPRTECLDGAAASAQPRPIAAATAAAEIATAEATGVAVQDAAVLAAAGGAAVPEAAGGATVAATGGEARAAVGSEAELEAAQILTRGEFLRGVTPFEPSGTEAPPWARPGNDAEAQAQAQALTQGVATKGSHAEALPGLGPSSPAPSRGAGTRGTVVLKHPASSKGWRFLEEARKGSPDRSGEAAEPQSIPRDSEPVPESVSGDPTAGLAPGGAVPGVPQALAPASLRAGRRRLFPVRLSHGSLRRVLGIPEPGEKKSTLIRERTAAVRKQMNAAVRTAQESAAAEFVSGVFFILVPLSIGAVVYTAVGHFIAQLGPAPAMPSEPEAITWYALSVLPSFPRPPGIDPRPRPRPPPKLLPRCFLAVPGPVSPNMLATCLSPDPEPA